ncbi:MULTISPECIES: hypothetical protein [Methylobacteriaceae]|uniref:hypothetical protein n=1 Tax=Methylobacteriaceae TaxID=119045 RepID=UPI002F357C5B
MQLLDDEEARRLVGRQALTEIEFEAEDRRRSETVEDGLVERTISRPVVTAPGGLFRSG